LIKLKIFFIFLLISLSINISGLSISPVKYSDEVLELFSKILRISHFQSYDDVIKIAAKIPHGEFVRVVRTIPKSIRLDFLLDVSINKKLITESKALVIYSKLKDIPKSDTAFFELMKNMDEIPLSSIDNIIRDNHRFIRSITKIGDIDFINTRTMGSFGDWMTNKKYTAMGYTKFPSKMGPHGFDNVFVLIDSNNNIKEVLIVENKVNSSQLNTVTNQMSDDWVLKKIQEMKNYNNKKIRDSGGFLQDVYSNTPEILKKVLIRYDLKEGTATSHILDSNAMRLMETEKKWGVENMMRTWVENQNIKTFQ